MADNLPAVIEDEPEPTRRPERDRELCGLKRIREQLLGGPKGGGLWDHIEQGFQAQATRSNEIMDNWDAYKCKLTGAQYYNGNNQVFFPVLGNAIRARVTRFSNQLFPQSGRYIDAVSGNGDLPFAQIALMEHYIRRAQLKNAIIKPLLKNGDIEGNYTLYVDWKTRRRKVMTKGMVPVSEAGAEFPEYGEVEDIIEEDIIEDGPDFEVLSDSDVLFLPVTAKSIRDCVEAGGAVCVRRRFTKRGIKMMIAEGEIDKKEGERFLESMNDDSDDKPGRRDTAKKVGEAAGIRVNKGIKTAVVCEVWTRLKVPGDGDGYSLCRVLFGGDDCILTAKRNPYWNDRVPVVTRPLDRDATSLKGRPPVSDCLPIQIAANDMVNEALDVSNLAAMPIVASDPEKNPKSAQMVLGLGAVWDVNPDNVKFLEFPALYEQLLPFIERLEMTIYQTLGVNPAMLPNSTGKVGVKRNQAEVALEQQVDILTTADAVSVVEDLLNEALEIVAEYDHQFRDRPLTVRAFGPMGARANSEEIEPQVLGQGISFQWLGVEAARNAAMAQQQIAFLGAAMKIPPQLLPGYKLDLSAALQSIALTQFGSRIAPLTLISLKDQQSVDPEMEEQMLGEGFQVMPHPMDDDVKHLQVHMQALQQEGDPNGNRNMHIMGHQQQLQAKATAAAQQQGQMPRQPGGGRPGSMNEGPRPIQSQPGALPPDKLRAVDGGAPRR